jgi:hypothetical protein
MKKPRYYTDGTQEVNAQRQPSKNASLPCARFMENPRDIFFFLP